MKRLHIRVSVEDLDASIRFYSNLFAIDEGETVCCYAKSTKSWIEDPQGVRRETFLTTGESTVYGSEAAASTAAACCVPRESAAQREPTAACCTRDERAHATATKAACCA